MVTCPECDSQIDVEQEDLDEGDLIACEECGAELRVLGLNPLELESVEEEDEEEGHADAEEGDDNEHWQ
jgi:alpha-aminoadipate carrier protein LysW